MDKVELITYQKNSLRPRVPVSVLMINLQPDMILWGVSVQRLIRQMNRKWKVLNFLVKMIQYHPSWGDILH